MELVTGEPHPTYCGSNLGIILPINNLLSIHCKKMVVIDIFLLIKFEYCRDYLFDEFKDIPFT